MSTPLPLIDPRKISPLASLSSSICLIFLPLRTLKFSCGSFSASHPLFSISCSLVDKIRFVHPRRLSGDTGGATTSDSSHLRPPPPSHPLFVSTFRINTCTSVDSKRLYPRLESTLMKKGGRGPSAIFNCQLSTSFQRRHQRVGFGNRQSRSVFSGPRLVRKLD
jgi:hypothetical protein